MISVVRENKDSLFASDCYLTRVNLRRPIKDDVVKDERKFIFKITDFDSFEEYRIHNDAELYSHYFEHRDRSKLKENDRIEYSNAFFRR